jgi:hypothetical protein
MYCHSVTNRNGQRYFRTIPECTWQVVKDYGEGCGIIGSCRHGSMDGHGNRVNEVRGEESFPFSRPPTRNNLVLTPQRSRSGLASVPFLHLLIMRLCCDLLAFALVPYRYRNAECTAIQHLASQFMSMELVIGCRASL